MDLNRVVRAAALVMTSVAMSSAITLWAVRGQEQVTQDEIRLIVEGAEEQLKTVVYPDAAPVSAHRETEQALAVQAVQQGVSKHRVSTTSDTREVGAQTLLVHRYTVTDQDGLYPVCLVLTQRLEVEEPGRGFYAPSHEDGPCRDPQASGDE